MKTGKIKSAGILFTALLLTGIMASGQPGPGPANRKAPEPGQVAGFQPGMRMAGMLDLTEAQQEQVKELRIAHLKEVLPLKNKMAELKAQYRTLVTAEKTDQKAINNNIDEQTKVLNKIMKSGADFRLKFRDLLTEDQRLILDSHTGRKVGMKGNSGNCRGMYGMHKGLGSRGYAQKGMHPGWGRMNMK
ncbi:MAG: Spy/CpxP family protein refolding chaperone [Chlorobi bacterium]|nr:Spy/CpxP family protein refolding chaperone [Chlorobiota bacterium]